MTTVTADILSELKANLAPFSSRDWAIGVSGGIDSMVLYHAVRAAFPEQALHIVHVNHNISPHAKEWEDFVQRKTLERGDRFSSQSVFCAKPSEKEAREKRYTAFKNMLGMASSTIFEPSSTLLLLAHHKDDQIETVLWRFTRGSPIQGLQGMAQTVTSAPGASYDLMRPLLAVSKASIRAYAQQHNLRYVSDPSNDDTSYTRNKLRHEVIPSLSPHSISTTQELLRHNFEALKHLLERYLGSAGHIALSPDVLQHSSTLWTVISLWISRYHFEHPSHIELLDYCNQIQKGCAAKLLIGNDALIYNRENSIIYRVSQQIPRPVTITLTPEAPRYRGYWGCYIVTIHIDFSGGIGDVLNGCDKTQPREITLTLSALSARAKLELPNRICCAATLWKERALPAVLRPYTPGIRLSNGRYLGYGSFEAVRLDGIIEGCAVTICSETL